MWQFGRLSSKVGGQRQRTVIFFELCKYVRLPQNRSEALQVDSYNTQLGLHRNDCELIADLVSFYYATSCLCWPRCLLTMYMKEG